MTEYILRAGRGDLNQLLLCVEEEIEAWRKEGINLTARWRQSLDQWGLFLTDHQ